MRVARPRTTLATQLSVVLTAVVAVAVLIGGVVANRVVRDAVYAEVADTVLAVLAQSGPRGGGPPGQQQGGGGGPVQAPDMPEIAPEDRDLIRFRAEGGTFVPTMDLPTLDLPTGEQVATVPLGGPGEGPEPVRLVAPGGRGYMAAGLTGAPGQADTVLMSPLDEADATIGSVMRRLGLAALGLLAGLALLIQLLTRLSIRPLARIERTAGELAGGRRDARIGRLDHPKDLAVVAHAFDDMADKVEAAFIAQEAQEDRLRQFVADASHELRTPLTAIRGHAEMFRMTPKPEKRERAMQRIEDQAARMGRLVNDMLLLAELDGSATAENEQPATAVDLVEVVRGAMDDLAAVQPARPVAVDLPEDRVLVSGAEEELRRVVENVTSNARKHTPASAAVRAGLAVEGDRVVLTIADEGPGLPEGAEDKAFDRFWRSSRNVAEGEGSSGLGLPIVAGLLARRDGEVHLTSVPGEGVTVTITLPRWTGPVPATILHPATADTL